MAKPLMHIFKAGKQTTAAGEAIEFSDSELSASAAAYDPAKHEAPICIGHPQSDMPAYGWIKSLRADGGNLMAERHQVDPAFAEMARAGKFKKVSAKFYRPDSPSNPVPGVWYLRHVAMLGAQPPAVKGLNPVEFKDSEEGLVEFADIEFSDPAFGYIARMFRGLRDYLIDSVGLEKADQVLPEWGIGSVEELGRERDNPTNANNLGTAFSEAAPITPQETDVSAELLAKAQADLAAAQKTAKDATDALAAEKAATAKAKRDARLAEHAEFAEGLVAANQLLPKDKPLVVSVLDALEGDAPVEFGEGDDKKPAAAALRELLGKLPKHGLDGKHVATKANAGAVDGGPDGDVQFSEAGTRFDADRLALHNKATALEKQQGISYLEAVRQLTRG